LNVDNGIGHRDSFRFQPAGITGSIWGGDHLKKFSDVCSHQSIPRRSCQERIKIQIDITITVITMLAIATRRKSLIADFDFGLFFRLTVEVSYADGV
jgi:hypothetical protein